MKSNFPSPIFKKVPHFTSLFLSNARYYCENKNCLEITRKFSFVTREIHSLQNEHTLQINLCASVWKWKATYFATPVSVSVGVCLLSPPIKSSDSERGSLERGRRHINILSASTFGVFFFFSWGALLLRHKKGGIKRSDAKHERSLLQARRMFKQIPAATSEHGLWELLITWKSSTSMHKKSSIKYVWQMCLNVSLRCHFNWMRWLKKSSEEFVSTSFPISLPRFVFCCAPTLRGVWELARNSRFTKR